MNIECSQGKILEGISRIEKIAGKHMTLPVLSCLLFDAKKNNTVTIRATNLDLGVEVVIPAKTNEEGIAAVPASTVNSFISSLKASDKPISLKVVDGNLVVNTEHTNGTIKTMPPEDFPNIPKIQDGKKFTVSSADFVKGLKSVWYSASTSGIKPELSSVYIYCDKGFAVFAATDSFRLAEKRIKLKKDNDFGQILIPFKNISEIVRILESVNEEIEVELSKNQISFSHKGLYLVSRIIDGIFPDYQQIIPKEKDIKTDAIVLKQDLINSLKLSHVFSDRFNQINLKVQPSNKKFEIKTKNSDIGETINSLEAALSGEDIEINFNYRYIADCFQSIDADSLTLSLSGMNRPMVIRPVSDPTFIYIVMPMNR